MFRGVVIRKQAGDQPEEWEELHRIADEHADEFAEAFRNAVEATRDGLTLREMENAFEDGDLGGAEEAVDWHRYGVELLNLSPIIIATVMLAGQRSLDFLPDEVIANMRFDLTNPRSVDFIRQHTGELIQGLQDSSRLAVRDIIERSFQDGIPPRRAARHIRDVVGLTERQALAVDNLRRELVEQGVPIPEITRRTNQYADRLLADRAETIARTETIKAANVGQELLWQEAVENGLIDPARTRKEWITTPDDRLCEFCEELDGVRVPLDGTFNSPLGPVGEPTLHPRCRCAMRLVFDTSGGWSRH